MAECAVPFLPEARRSRLQPWLAARRRSNAPVTWIYRPQRATPENLRRTLSKRLIRSAPVVGAGIGKMKVKIDVVAVHSCAEPFIRTELAGFLQQMNDVDAPRRVTN
jgi:hypothetical protein